MLRYFDEMRAVIERHGGTVEKYIGDAIMAVFGIPHVHEDDALRAVRAAVEMREALAALNAHLERPLAMRTGINTGQVVTGDSHPLVTGDAVNLASRLQSAAEVNEILIGDATYHLVRDAAVAELLAGLVVKGKSVPVEAWRLTAVIPRCARPLAANRLAARRAGGRAGATPAGVRPRGRAAVVPPVHALGAAGVGKSRLAHEMLADFGARATVLTGRCLPYGDGITFWPLREIVRTLPDLRGLVGDDDAEIVCGAVGLGDASTPAEESFRALRKLIEAIAQDAPLVLTFEDVHWGEPAFLDFVEHLAEWMRDRPVLLLCLARPELVDVRRSWGGGRLNATTILLEPLDDDDSERLVANLGGDEVAPELRATITEVAEGNPLFLEEMMAMVRDDPAAAASVPPTIHALLTVRIEALEPREREVLQTLSVVGRFFSHAAAAALAGDVNDALISLRQKDLVRPHASAAGRGVVYRFRHVLIRDAAYDALPKTVRAALHLRLAEWLSATEQDAAREFDELVGYHLERAVHLRNELGEAADDVAASAAAALARAGRRALARGDAGAARSLLQRATALPSRADAAQVERLLDYVSALQEQGEFAAAEQALGDARAAAIALPDRRLEARARVEQSFLALFTDPHRWVDEAVDVAEHAIVVLEESGDDFGLARAWLLLLLLHYGRCRVAEMEQALEPALRYARRATDGRQVAVILNASVRALLVGPTPVEEAVDRAKAIADEPEADRALAAVVGGVVACLDAMRGRFARRAQPSPRAMRRWRISDAPACRRRSGRTRGSSSCSAEIRPRRRTSSRRGSSRWSGSATRRTSQPSRVSSPRRSGPVRGGPTRRRRRS